MGVLIWRVVGTWLGFLYWLSGNQNWKGEG